MGAKLIAFFKKETLIKLIDTRAIHGFMIVEEVA